MCRKLAGHGIPWQAVDLYQVDERIAPDGDRRRNLTHLLASLPPDALARLRPMPVTAANPELAAAEYEATLPARLDLIHLGLGPDGHTASLIPGDDVLTRVDRDVTLTTGAYQGYRRMTLTYPPMERARSLLFLVTGAEKADALRRLLAGDRSIPAGRLEGAAGLVLADQPAIGAAEHR
jgi:6-phosphogluconolactonase